MHVYVLAHLAVMILACGVRMKPLGRLENSVIYYDLAKNVDSI